MTVDDEGKKAEVQPGFLAQLQAILNVLPAYTWYAPPSGSLTFVSKRQADFLGLPNEGWFGFVAGYDHTSLGLNYCSPTQVVVPSVSWATVLQGTALTVFVEMPSRPTMFKPGPVTASGREPATGGFGTAPSAGADA